MKELFDAIIADEIKPFLKNYGYRKKSLHFYKTLGDIIFMVKFVLSKRNGWGNTRFYIQGEIYSKEIDRVAGNPELTEPKYDEYHYSTNCFPLAGYTITPETTETEINKMLIEIKEKINEEEGFFNQINTTEDLMEKMLLENGLHKYKEIFAYLLIKDENEKLEKYVKSLYEKFGQENRWKIFEDAMNEILMENNKNSEVMKMIK